MSEKKSTNSWFSQITETFLKNVSLLPINLFSLSIPIGIVAGYQILKGHSLRQFLSIWHFRKTKTYSKQYPFIVDRNETQLQEFFSINTNMVTAMFIDGHQGIGKTSYLQFLADKYSKNAPVLYISLRDFFKEP